MEVPLSDLVYPKTPGEWECARPVGDVDAARDTVAIDWDVPDATATQLLERCGLTLPHYRAKQRIHIKDGFTKEERRITSVPLRHACRHARMQCPYPSGFLRTVYEDTCAHTLSRVSALLARVVATHAEEVTLSFDWEALHLYHCARRLYPARRVVLREEGARLGEREVDVPVPESLQIALLSPVRLDEHSRPVEPSYPLEVAFAIGSALRYIVASPTQREYAYERRKLKWFAILSPTAMAPITPVRADRLAAYREERYELDPWPLVLVLSHDARRTLHMKRLLASLHIDRYEIVTPVSIAEAATWTSERSSKRTKITPTQKSLCASEHRMLSHPHEGALLILEDDVAPFASDEDTRMMMRFLMQAPGVALLEWCYADNALCATLKLQLELVKRQKWSCAAAVYYADRDVRRRLLETIDAYETDLGVYPFDKFLSAHLRSADIPVTYWSPVVFQWDDEFTSTIEGSKRHIKKFCSDTTRAAVSKRYETFFVTNPNAYANHSCGAPLWPLIVIVVLVVVACLVAVGGVVRRVRQA
jgi:hypothetical protein